MEKYAIRRADRSRSATAGTREWEFGKVMRRFCPLESKRNSKFRKSRSEERVRAPSAGTTTFSLPKPQSGRTTDGSNQLDAATCTLEGIDAERDSEDGSGRCIKTSGD